VTEERTVLGKLLPTGLRPGFLHKFEKRGVEMPPGVYGGAPTAAQLAAAGMQ